MNAKHRKPSKSGILVLVLGALVLAIPAPLKAQDRPTQRQLRTYIPPDQLVSFLPSTPFDQFIEFLNPIFERVAGKQIIDPETRTDPIGIAISGMHFFDAFELVLEYNGLTFRETERFFIAEEAPVPERVSSGTAAGAPGAAAVQQQGITAETREIQISAVLFELNHTRAREVGIDWNVFFGDGTASGGGTSTPGTAPRFFLKTDRFFENLDEILLGPDFIELSTLTQFFRFLESEGVGETVANPQITVQSGEKGRIQIGSDVPVQTRDFAGNTLTQFFSTGIIVDVTPTLIRDQAGDTLGAPLLDFIHLNVQVEKSSSRPSNAGPIIDRNTATTQVLLLNGEQTVIGGLYSNEESVARRGVPLLKDLPGWFFGLRYLFGVTQRSIVQKELLIVLQARMLDPLQARAQRPFEEQLLERHRRQVRENVRRVDEGLGREVKLPPAGDAMD